MSTVATKPKPIVTNPPAMASDSPPTVLKDGNGQALKGENLLQAASKRIATPQYVIDACKELSTYDSCAAASHVTLSIAARRFATELGQGNYGSLPVNVTPESLAKYVIRQQLPGHSESSVTKIYKLHETIDEAEKVGVDLTQCNSPAILYLVQGRLEALKSNKQVLQKTLEAVAKGETSISTLTKWLGEKGFGRKSAAVQNARKVDDRIRPSIETVTKWCGTQSDEVCVAMVASLLTLLADRGYSFTDPNITAS